MEPIISSKTKMCRTCPTSLNLIDLHLPENDFIIKNLESFVFVEMELTKQLPKYICVNCNYALNAVLQFKAKISERFQEIKNIIEMSLEPIKNEIEFDFEKVILDDYSFEENQIKIEEPEIKIEILPTAVSLSASTSSSKPATNPENKARKERWLKFTGKCFYCQKDLASYKEMNEHHKTHTDCHLCPKKFISYDCFKYHYQNIHLKMARKDMDQTFSCQICGKEFKRKKNVSVHIRVFHNNERNHPCDICGKKFFEKTQLQTKSVHCNERSFICENCSKDFKTKNALNTHRMYTCSLSEKKMINSNNKTYICTFCGKQIRGQSGFESHERIHTQELPYECSVCNKKFRTKTHLNLHKRLHTGEKPYKCNLCPMRFRTLPILKNHKLSHGGSQAKKLSCKLCGMTTVYKVNLATHMRTVHREIKNFDCKICNENFPKISLLKAHSIESHNFLLS